MIEDAFFCCRPRAVCGIHTFGSCAELGCPRGFPVAEPMGALRSAGMGWGALPAPWPTEPLGTYSPSRLALRGVTKALARDPSPEAGHGLSSPSPRTDNRRGWLMGEGTRSCRPRFSFARGCGEQGLGDLERLREPLPVLESARERRRVLGRTVDQGSGDAPCPWFIVARPRPRCAGNRARIGGGRSPQGRRLPIRRGSGLVDASAGRDSSRSRRASSVPGARSGKHQAGGMELAHQGDPPRGGGPGRAKGRREPNRTGVAAGRGIGVAERKLRCRSAGWRHGRKLVSVKARRPTAT